MNQLRTSELFRYRQYIFGYKQNIPTTQIKNKAYHEPFERINHAVITEAIITLDQKQQISLKGLKI